MIQSDSIANQMMWDTTPTGLYTYKQLDSLPAATFRSLNETGTVKFAQPKTKSGDVKILNFDSAIDEKVIQRTGNRNGEIAAQMMIMNRSMMSTAEYYMIHGDNIGTAGAEEFDGWQVIAERNSATVSAGTNGGALALDDFKSMIEMARQCAGGDSSRMNIWMNSTHNYKLWTLLMASSTSGVRWTVDQAGNQVEMFDGVKINILRKDAAGNTFLPFTETQGTSSVASSIYCTVKSTGIGVPGVFMIQDGAPVFKTVETGIGMTLHADWGLDQNESHDYAVVRYKGILNS
jgi:hypothetical protein